MAGIFKYFERRSLPKRDETGLGETVTKEANAAVEKVIEEERNAAKGQKRKYTHFAPEQRAKIAKYAAECGDAAAVRHFSSEYQILGENTVRLFKKQYVAELKKKDPDYQNLYKQETLRINYIACIKNTLIFIYFALFLVRINFRNYGVFLETISPRDLRSPNTYP